MRKEDGGRQSRHFPKRGAKKKGQQWPKVRCRSWWSAVRPADSAWSSVPRTFWRSPLLSMLRGITHLTWSTRRSAAVAICAACIARTSRSSDTSNRRRPKKLSRPRPRHPLPRPRRTKMHADPAGVMTGTHFLDGDHACCEGALAAGARFSSGYPITPSTEVVERFAARVPTVGGTFIQMEDELAASIAL